MQMLATAGQSVTPVTPNVDLVALSNDLITNQRL
jgi:hypothetical protein